MQLLTVDKGRVLLVVYSQAAPVFRQHLRLMKLGYNYYKLDILSLVTTRMRMCNGKGLRNM